MEVKVFESQLSSVAQLCCRGVLNPGSSAQTTICLFFGLFLFVLFVLLTIANIFGCCPCLVLFVFLCTEILFGSIHERHEKARFGLECLKKFLLNVFTLRGLIAATGLFSFSFHSSHY